MNITRRIPSAFVTGASLLALALPASAGWAQTGTASGLGEPGQAVSAEDNQTADEVQTPEPAAAEDASIVVTGFRASLRSAINQKRTEAGVVDAIVAEDIAAFPDLNLAESLQRIPGVAISRQGGEGRQISVRGLGPDYTRVRLNGIEALTTFGGSDSGGGGGTNRGRGFDFNIFASELFSNLTVRKTSSANVEEGSLGATVDLQTGRPFNYREPTIVLSAQAGYNDVSEKVDPRLALVVSRSNESRTFGALFSLAYGQRHVREEGVSFTRWDNGPSQSVFCSPLGYDINPTTTGVQRSPGTATNCNNAAGPARPAGTAENISLWQTASAPTTFLPRIPSQNSWFTTEKRLGMTGAIQWQPTPATLINLDLLYARLGSSREEATLQNLGLSRPAIGKGEMIVRAITLDENNNLLRGTFDNADMRSQARITTGVNNFKQVVLSGSHEFSDRFKVNALIGRADSQFKIDNDTTITIDAANVPNYTIDFSENDRLPLITFGFDPTNPASYTSLNGISEVRLRPLQVGNVMNTAKLDGAFEAIDGLTLRAGADYRKAMFERSAERRRSETVSQTLTPAQIAALGEVYEGYGKGLDLPAGQTTSWFVPNIPAYAAALGIYCDCGIYEVGSEINSSARGGTIDVSEENIGGFGMAEFNFDIGVPVRGDIGVRHVRTRQVASGFTAVGNEIEWVTAKRTYSHTLPSMNLAIDITPQVIARFAAAKTIARPELSALTPGGDVSIQGVNRTFSTGNPMLDPTTSKNLDLSLEYYPQPGALYAVSAFYKKISTFAQTLRTTEPFSSLGLPVSLLEGTAATPDMDFVVTRPVNSPGGDLKGIEINIQQPLTFLPGFLSDLGVLLNYTYVESEIEYQTSPVPGAPTIQETLTGLSRNAANATLYYEGDKFSIRGSAAYRDGYLGAVPGGNNNAVEGTNSTLNFDARASYNINEQLEISLEAINLTNEPEDSYVDYTNRVNAYRVSGRQFFLGARYRF
jgi:iron complex outermembrane recepter protein